ncbi:hypothetical protein BGP75_04810 [Motiliproteus sp. MSK22-1]|nr:hypothetical protein BGP75_04810 [Motiliproteus sp. MSK22-1]
MGTTTTPLQKKFIEAGTEGLYLHQLLKSFYLTQLLAFWYSLDSDRFQRRQLMFCGKPHWRLLYHEFSNRKL